MEKSDIDIIVIHDDIRDNSVILTQLREDFNSVVLIKDPEEGLEYIKSHKSDKIIVVLDINFGETINGFDVLDGIRKESLLIEVIILSANDIPAKEMTEKIHRLFGAQAFDYIVRTPQNNSILIDAVKRAKEKIDNNISNVIAEWIKNSEEDKDKPIYVSSEGDSYSLNDILKEIRLQTEIGIEFSQKLNQLTIDLLLRNKEKL